MKKRRLKDYPRWSWKFLRDNCQGCHGTRGGQLGNENVIKGVILCDDCSCDPRVLGGLDAVPKMRQHGQS